MVLLVLKAMVGQTNLNSFQDQFQDMQLRVDLKLATLKSHAEAIHAAPPKQ